MACYYALLLPFFYTIRARKRNNIYISNKCISTFFFSMLFLVILAISSSLLLTHSHYFQITFISTDAFLCDLNSKHVLEKEWINYTLFIFYSRRREGEKVSMKRRWKFTALPYHSKLCMNPNFIIIWSTSQLIVIFIPTFQKRTMSYIGSSGQKNELWERYKNRATVFGFAFHTCYF